jgi:hypothetical protein
MKTTKTIEKKKKKLPPPPVFSTPEEEDEFWQTHSPLDFEHEAVGVPAPRKFVRPKSLILNDHQLKISQQKLKELRQAFSKLKKKYPKPEDFKFYSLGVREHIEQLEKEIKSYFESKAKKQA